MSWSQFEFTDLCLQLTGKHIRKFSISPRPPSTAPWKPRSEVGISYIAEQFAKENYKSYILIDFNRVGSEVTDLFINYLDDLDHLFMYLSAYYNQKLYQGDSLIIFDEVQMFPKTRATLKYLVMDGRYDYMEAGSLMSIRKNVKDIVIPSEERHQTCTLWILKSSFGRWETKRLSPLCMTVLSEKNLWGRRFTEKQWTISGNIWLSAVCRRQLISMHGQKIFARFVKEVVQKKWKSL